MARNKQETTMRCVRLRSMGWSAVTSGEKDRLGRDRPEASILLTENNWSKGEGIATGPTKLSLPLLASVLQGLTQFAWSPLGLPASFRSVTK